MEGGAFAVADIHWHKDDARHAPRQLEGGRLQRTIPFPLGDLISV
jgi:hypothetical protein